LDYLLIIVCHKTVLVLKAKKSEKQSEISID